jgi:hypothetical protein
MVGKVARKHHDHEELCELGGLYLHGPYIDPTLRAFDADAHDRNRKQ